MKFQHNGKLFQCFQRNSYGISKGEVVCPRQHSEENPVRFFQGCKILFQNETLPNLLTEEQVEGVKKKRKARQTNIMSGIV